MVTRCLCFAAEEDPKEPEPFLEPEEEAEEAPASSELAYPLDPKAQRRRSSGKKRREGREDSL